MKTLHASERIYYAQCAIEDFWDSGYVNLIQSEEGQRRHPNSGEVQKFLNRLYMAGIPLNRLNKELAAHGCRVNKKRHYIHGYVKVRVFKKIAFKIITGREYPK